MHVNFKLCDSSLDGKLIPAIFMKNFYEKNSISISHGTFFGN